MIRNNDIGGFEAPGRRFSSARVDAKHRVPPSVGHVRLPWRSFADDRVIDLRSRSLTTRRCETLRVTRTTRSSPPFVRPTPPRPAAATTRRATFIVWSAIFDACCPVNQILARVRRRCPFYLILFVSILETVRRPTQRPNNATRFFTQLPRSTAITR